MSGATKRLQIFLAAGEPVKPDFAFTRSNNQEDSDA
jgi:hypothetical protein